jgi:hypothetical protein
MAIVIHLQYCDHLIQVNEHAPVPSQRKSRK